MCLYVWIYTGHSNRLEKTRPSTAIGASTQVSDMPLMIPNAPQRNGKRTNAGPCRASFEGAQAHATAMPTPNSAPITPKVVLTLTTRLWIVASSPVSVSIPWSAYFDASLKNRNSPKMPSTITGRPPGRFELMLRRMHCKKEPAIACEKQGKEECGEERHNPGCG